MLSASRVVQAVFWGSEEPLWEKAEQHCPTGLGQRGTMKI